MPKKTREVWKLKEYNKCYCFERYGNVYTYVFGIKKATDYPWIQENKPKALQIKFAGLVSYLLILLFSALS